MAVYSTLLAAGVYGGGDSAVVYTAPPLKTVVVRDITVASSDGSTGTMDMPILCGSIRVWACPSMFPHANYNLTHSHTETQGAALRRDWECMGMGEHAPHALRNGPERTKRRVWWLSHTRRF